MKYWLFDFEITEKWKQLWMDLWGASDLHLIGLARSKKRIINLIRGALFALHKSKKDDIIFCWFDFQAILCFFFGKLTFRRRKIVALNIMCKFNNSLKGKIYAKLYKLALSSKNFYGTVTSKEYGKYINLKLKVKRDFVVIHDANESKYLLKPEDRIPSIPKSIFMGGTSSRDWDFAFDLAKAMPDITFNFVMTDIMYKRYEGRILKNTKVESSIPLKEFNAIACASSIIIMPTTTEAPAGLMLLYLAAANYKFYITNYTATSCEYINNDRGCILPKRLDVWVESIRYFLGNSEEAQRRAHNLHNFIEQECSLEKYVNGMKIICDKIEKSRSDV